MNSVRIDVFLEITPRGVLFGIDEANAVVDRVRYAILALQIDPRWKVHDLVGELLDLEVMQSGRAHNHLEPFSVGAHARYALVDLVDEFAVSLAKKTVLEDIHSSHLSSLATVVK